MDDVYLQSNNKETENYKEFLDKILISIFSYPNRLKLLIENTSGSFLNSSSNENGFTLKQVIHSSADYVINSYIRLKLMLTEDEPVIRSYYKERWIELPDSNAMYIKTSLLLIENIHNKLMLILRNLKGDDLSRKYFDPEINKTLTVKEFLEQYIQELNNQITLIIRTKFPVKPVISQNL
jgi:hypothetical protein